jgi:hypothetical protein
MKAEGLLTNVGHTTVATRAKVSKPYCFIADNLVFLIAALNAVRFSFKNV